MNKEKKLKVATKSHLKLKQKIAKILDIGVSRLKLKNEAAKKIFSSEYTTMVSNTLARDLVKEKEKYLTIIPKKRRLYKVYYQKKKLVNLEKEKRSKSLVEKKKPDFVTKKLNNYEELKKKNKVKDIYKDLNSTNYKLKKKLISKKDLHMDKIRNFRKILKGYKSKLTNKDYRQIYLKVKGNYYKTLNSLILQINTLKTDKEDVTQ